MTIKTLRHRAARLFQRVAPRIATAYGDMTTRATHATRKLVTDRLGYTVAGGPFEGMKCLKQANRIAPKLIGSFESELHPYIDKLIEERNYDRVLNVGCAEGHYAVGIARLLPNAAVHAYDISSLSRDLCRRQSELNHVGLQVEVHGEADCEELQKMIGERSLLFLDCEGAELDLLQPEKIPAMKRCDVLVEVHVNFNPELREILQERFEATHTIDWIYPEPRDPEEYPELNWLTPKQRYYALYEYRPPKLCWACMRAK